STNTRLTRNDRGFPTWSCSMAMARFSKTSELTNSRRVRSTIPLRSKPFWCSGLLERTRYGRCRRLVEPIRAPKICCSRKFRALIVCVRLLRSEHPMTGVRISHRCAHLTPFGGAEMSYVLTPYLVDLDQVRQSVGSQDESL